MIKVNNKFNIGDELYTVARKNIEYKCPVCESTGTFNHNGYDVKCPHCFGKGKVKDSKTLWDVTDNKVKVRRIVISVWEDVITCKYKVDYNGMDCNVRNRAEDTLFSTKEEAEQWCKDKNTEFLKGI